MTRNVRMIAQCVVASLGTLLWAHSNSNYVPLQAGVPWILSFISNMDIRLPVLVVLDLKKIEAGLWPLRIAVDWVEYFKVHYLD